MICSWCRRDCEGPALYHICTDGTDFAMRMIKTSEEIMEEYRRQDRISQAYGIMGNNKLAKRDYGVMVPWTADDIKLLHGMKIKP